MGLIVYEEKTIIDAKRRVEICNSEILEALKKINNEFINIESTLSTPKSTKNIPVFIDYYNKKINFLQNKKSYYDGVFNAIISEYRDYTNTVGQMVGDKNG